MSPDESPGEYQSLIVRIANTATGSQLVIDSDETQQRVALPPAIFVVRLWRDSGTLTLRGYINLHGSDIHAAIQSNADLERLIKVWLFGA